MPIRILDPVTASRIAAGEVVERPASVVKELIENAVDAGASSIEVFVKDGPTSSIVVADDGHGIPSDEMRLAFSRHATSKLPDGNVSAIRTLGFRGEALPSLSAVARVRLVSRAVGAEHAFEVTAAGDGITSPRPAAHPTGTRVEVAELFHRYPARLRFLKSDRTEMAAIRSVVDAAALSFPDIEFAFSSPGMRSRHRPCGRRGEGAAVAARARDVLGPAYGKDGIAVDHEADGIKVMGLACLPTRARKDANGILLAVNGRSVSDKGLLSAVRSAYAGLMATGLSPMAFISLDVPPELVDVNVHPRKAEVRLAEATRIHGVVSRAISEALRGAGLRTTSDLADLAADLAAASPATPGDPRRLPLGRAIGQANGSWIISETMDGIVIVDQHAAHERVLLERLRAAIGQGDGSSIELPSPVLVPLTADEAAAMEARLDELSRLGLRMVVGPSHVSVLATPAALGAVDAAALVADIASAALEDPEADVVGGMLLDRMATAGCRAAIKAGERLSLEQADSLLREMEETPNASTCNHGRPVVAFLSGRDLERLFARR